ncbi:hypothetical protein CBQ26_00470 [Deinococcus indicus]|uniref:Uncharacterized protein n=1 Tax=Deinococcus indicus TaxID=223556 RepID=A0A246BTE5_9DEIO|nr:hypothetical protein [Deinococcus indicus]OWL98966.1 hypothetical protein CBQ26_00470 [Deinococcus indicus]
MSEEGTRKEQNEQAVLGALRDCVALTSRRITATYGPRVNWGGLLTRGAIREVRTTYGPVLTLTDSELQRAGIQYRLRGPASLADRAYMMDAVQLLQKLGYEWVEWNYKAYRDQGLTGHITSAYMRVPEEEYWPLQNRYTGNRRTREDGTRLEMLGEPRLYARCSGGGIKVTEARGLLKLHGTHIAGYWHSPLLLVVPEETAALRAYVRRVNEDARDRRQRGNCPDAPFHPVITVFTLPLPSLVRRPGQVNVD